MSKTRRFKANSGFTLTEVIVALIFISLVAALTIPSVLNVSTSNRAMLQAKSIAAEALRAALKRKQDDPLNAPTSASEIADLMKYTIKPAAGVHNSSGDDCSAVTCYRFPDGGVLVSDVPSAWGAPGANIGTFRYDPDGTGPLLPVVLRLDYNNERIATQDAFDGTTGNDPGYVKRWTKL